MTKFQQEGDCQLVSVTKAGAIGNTAPRDVVIQIHGEPDDRMSLKNARAFYEQEAERLCDALEHSLPGGTLDELLALMMKRRASLFRVPLVYEKTN